jgi:hypothetical protein
MVLLSAHVTREFVKPSSTSRCNYCTTKGDLVANLCTFLSRVTNHLILRSPYCTLSSLVIIFWGKKLNCFVLHKWPMKISLISSSQSRYLDYRTNFGDYYYMRFSDKGLLQSLQTSGSCSNQHTYWHQKDTRRVGLYKDQLGSRGRWSEIT